MCQRLPLTSFLILPFQRITRLKMLVEVPKGTRLWEGLRSGGDPFIATAPLGAQGWAGSLGEATLPHCTDSTFQNILKRTAQGSEDEDMATKAFNALKEVSSVGRRCLAPRGLPGTPVCLQRSLSLHSPWSPSGSLRLGWGSQGWGCCG